MIEWDIEELAYRAAGKTEEETEKEINDGDIDDFIYEKYDIGFDQYCKIVEDLIKFTPVVEAGISGGKFHAFVADNRMIVKVEAK